MILTILAALGIPLGGWAGERTLTWIAKVNDARRDVEELKDDITYIRSRTDAIFDHLVSERLDERRRRSR